MKEEQVYEIELGVNDKRGWERVHDFLEHIEKIQKIKNIDSKLSIEGGALCDIVVTIRVNEVWR